MNIWDILCSSRKYQYLSPPPPPPHEGQRKFRGNGGGEGRGCPEGGNFRGVGRWPLESFFWGLRVRLMSKLSVIWLLIGVSKQKLLFWTMIFYFRSAECFFHGLHDSSCNTIVIGSWINFRLSISSCFVTEYIVVFNVMWSYSNKPSSNMFYWKGVIEVDWFERWHHLCRVRPYRLHGSQWLTVDN